MPVLPPKVVRPGSRSLSRQSDRRVGSEHSGQSWFRQAAIEARYRAQDKSVAEVAGMALARVQRTMAHYVAVLTDPEYLANSRAVLEAKLPLLTQQVRARAAFEMHCH